ncbi:conserved exported hypothetical protein [Candidatus Sulfopaludibacter sp. SbA3]|nr:conserved exported hypothetical protein [Candidatus Sulfopaludibacter sp. SbA3]
MRFAILLVCSVACFAQTDAANRYLPHDLSAGFRYEVKLGQNSYNLNDAPGYSVKYSYRPLRWLALEAGMEQIPRPIGASVCCEYQTNAYDELFLVPFGARYVWEPQGQRLRLSLGGGGAYMNHTFGTELESGAMAGASGWGGQFVASGDCGLLRSGRLRAGLTARYYYIHVGLYVTGRILTVGPDFTFSFR